MRVLFICSQNRLRSPTAEQVFSTWKGLDVTSAGLNDDAVSPVTPELLDWAQLIFVMELVHRHRLKRKFGTHLRNNRVVCLDIKDEYEFMDPALIALLSARVPKYLRTGQR